MLFPATVRAVLDDRLILLVETAEEPRTVWIFRARGGKSRIRVLDPNPASEIVRLKPRAVPEVDAPLQEGQVLRVSRAPREPAEPPAEEAEPLAEEDEKEGGEG